LSAPHPGPDDAPAPAAPPPPEPASPADPLTARGHRPGWDWIDSEAPIGAAAFAHGKRLLGRARASWPLWVSLSLMVSGAIVVWQHLRPPTRETTVVVRFTDGKITLSDLPTSLGTLRAYIMDLAFSRRNLLEIALRHPEIFHDAVKDPDDTVDEIMDATNVELWDNDMLPEHPSAGDQRSVRIEISYRASRPATSWTMAHELVDLLGKTEFARQRRELERRASIGEHLDPLGKQATEAEAATSGAVKRAISPEVELQIERHQAVVTTARLGLHALDAHQSMRFEVIDAEGNPLETNPPMGRVPSFFLFLALTLPVAALIAGATDPRILDVDDLSGAGVTALGRLPRPGARV